MNVFTEALDQFAKSLINSPRLSEGEKSKVQALLDDLHSEDVFAKRVAMLKRLERLCNRVAKRPLTTLDIRC